MEEAISGLVDKRSLVEGKTFRRERVKKVDRT